MNGIAARAIDVTSSKSRPMPILKPYSLASDIDWPLTVMKREMQMTRLSAPVPTKAYFSSPRGWSFFPRSNARTNETTNKMKAKKPNKWNSFSDMLPIEALNLKALIETLTVMPMPEMRMVYHGSIVEKSPNAHTAIIASLCRLMFSPLTILSPLLIAFSMFAAAFPPGEGWR